MFPLAARIGLYPETREMATAIHVEELRFLTPIFCCSVPLLSGVALDTSEAYFTVISPVGSIPFILCSKFCGVTHGHQHRAGAVREGGEHAEAAGGAAA